MIFYKGINQKHPLQIDQTFGDPMPIRVDRVKHDFVIRRFDKRFPVTYFVRFSMGIIGGKKIQVLRSRRGKHDFVIREDIERKKFLMFVSSETARKIMMVSEDLLMRPHMRKTSWSYEEPERWVEMEIVNNRFDRSLVIKSVSKDNNRWRRKVYIPEGKYGEGWLYLSRQIKTLLVKLRSDTNQPSHVQSLESTSKQGWMTIKTNKPVDIGGWELMVVCTIDHHFVDWRKVGRRLAGALETEEEFIFYPFSDNQALIAVGSIAERDHLCSINDLFDAEDGITLSLWNQAANGLSCQDIKGGWIGLSGIPFHLWNETMFTSIAAKMGGLQSIDANTSGLNDLSMARIRVNGDLSRIPARIEIENAGVRYPVDLRIIPEPVAFKSGMVKIAVSCGRVSTSETAINGPVEGLKNIAYMVDALEIAKGTDGSRHVEKNQQPAVDQITPAIEGKKLGVLPRTILDGMKQGKLMKIPTAGSELETKVAEESFISAEISREDVALATTINHVVCNKSRNNGVGTRIMINVDKIKSKMDALALTNSSVINADMKESKKVITADLKESKKVITADLKESNKDGLASNVVRGGFSKRCVGTFVREKEEFISQLDLNKPAADYVNEGISACSVLDSCTVTDGVSLGDLKKVKHVTGLGTDILVNPGLKRLTFHKKFNGQPTSVWKQCTQNEEFEVTKNKEHARILDNLAKTYFGDNVEGEMLNQLGNIFIREKGFNLNISPSAA